jgi:AcrR family transcriptional regulator
MPRPRFWKLPEERRRTVLDAAARAFAIHGFAGASMNAILADAGLSKGAAYYLFDDKVDLFATVVEVGWSRVAGEVGGLHPEETDAATFWPTLEALYTRQLAAFATDPWSWRAVRAAGAALLDPAAGPALSARLAPLLAVAHALAARARELGVVRDDLPEDLVFALVSAADGALDTWLLEHPDAASDPAVARAAFATLRALVTGPAGSRRG